MYSLIIKYTEKAKALRSVNTDASICAAVVYEEVIKDLTELKQQ